MKIVIFICLLTLSVCLSQPTTDAGNKTNTEAAPQKPTNIVPKDKTGTTEAPKPTEKVSNHTEPVTSLPPVKPANETVAPKNDTGKNDTTTVKPTDSTTTTVTPSTQSIPTTTIAPTVPTQSTPSTAKPTNNTNASSTIPPPPLQARGFDGASFVGGIILTLGLLAIGFMGFRYYKTQTERNYHTL